MDTTLLLLISGTASFIAGAVAIWGWHRTKFGRSTLYSQEILVRAEKEAKDLLSQAELKIKQKQLEQQRECELLFQQERKKIAREEERLQEREDKLEGRMSLVEKKLSDIEKREAILISKKEKLEDQKNETCEKNNLLTAQLEQLSGWTSAEAKDFLLNKVTNEIKTEMANRIRRIKKEAEEEAEREASKILATAIQRLAVPTVHEVTVNTVAIPSEEMKGRIIGREGRNIRSLERATGVNIIIDDTPGAVVISGFDPIRMAVAKTALTDLINDGRIHPTRIEEAVETATKSIKKQIQHYGEDAALRAGAINLHPELKILLGKLKFRFSYGQNILDHSLEVAHLMGMMAAELGLDERLAKRIGLLHDVGKALSHEVEGTHALIGHDVALKYGERPEVANGIGCHHNEMAPTTTEGSLCGAADAISASRTGARSEALDEYIKRLRRLEEMVCNYEGVEKAYALQAGREVRVVVLPDLIDDDGVVNLARDLTKRIEQELSYPGKIKVTVIREKRVVEYAI